MKYYKEITSPVGKLTLIETDGYLTNIYFSVDEFNKDDLIKKDTEILLKAACQLQEYFDKKRKTFDIKIKQTGTDFQMKVWNELKNIKYGEVKTYKDIAIKVGCPKGYRAVGMANNKNPIPIIVPCHRVIGSNNKLVGFSSGLDIKKFLLDLES